MIPFLDMRAALAELRNELDEAYARVCEGANFILGPELEAFEAEFAAFCGSKHCVGVGSGLDALSLPLKARGLGPGDEVIVPSQTFIATWLAVSMIGATPVAAEVDDETFNLDPSAVRAAITPRTRAIVPVHLFGQPAPMHALAEIAARHSLFLLEDAAQAHGARLGDARCGQLGDAAAFSFYPTKNLGCLGDGGAVVTDDADLAATLRKLRNYGSTQKYVHDLVCGNTRLDELQAAFLRVKLASLDRWNERRRRVAARYDQRLRSAGSIRTPRAIEGCEHVYHLYVIRSPERDLLQAELRERGIATQIHYPIPPHLQKAYGDLGIAPGALPVAERIARESLSLPMWPHMSDDQVDRVCDAILAATDRRLP